MLTDRERLSVALSQRYRLERELGHGGMAIVYLADDLKHRRKVALKVLRPELAAALGGERFLREIEITAQLEHPHILPLLDSGDADGLLYYVMPYVEGETLRQRLNREKQLSLDDALQIAREAADALSYAHSRGIVHRDIKPENILLAGGHVRVADFGIARAVTAAGGETLTETGIAIGTPAYMSPEQAGGEQDVDGRSDLYSLGCVLYEMLAGEAPFTGRSVQAVIAKRLSSPAPPVSILRETVPAHIEQALAKALARLPADRFATASRLADALAGIGPLPTRRRTSRVRTRVAIGAVALAGVAAVALAVPWGPSALSAHRVVVVPFENRTGEDSLAPLGRATADWINAGLLRIGPGVQVVPTAEVVQLLGSSGGAVSIATLAQRTGAVWIVRGTYYRQGDSLRFEAEILDGRQGTVVAGLDPVTAPARTPTTGIDRVREPVLGAMVALLRDPNRIPGSPTPKSFAAALLDQGGAYHRGDFREALRLSRLAQSLDTTRGWSGSINEVWYLYHLGQYPAADSVLRILEPHRSELRVAHWLLDWQRAALRADHQTAYQLWRANADTVGSTETPALGWVAYRVNRPREALAVLDQLGPKSRFRSYYYYYAMGAYHVLGRHREEVRAARRGRESYPQDMSILQGEVVAQAALGRIADVHILLDESLGLPTPDSTIWTAALQWQEWDEDALQPPPGGTPGSIARTAALEFRAHGSRRAFGEMVERSRVWYGSLTPDQASHRRIRWGLAQTLYLAERWQEARDLARGLVAEVADTARAPIDYLGFLGVLAARMGEAQEAQRIASELAGIQRPYLFGTPELWRARIAAVLGEKGQAISLLHEATAKGVVFGLWLHRDVDLESLRGYAPYEEFARAKG